MHFLTDFLMSSGAGITRMSPQGKALHLNQNKRVNSDIDIASLTVWYLDKSMPSIEKFNIYVISRSAEKRLHQSRPPSVDKLNLWWVILFALCENVQTKALCRFYELSKQKPERSFTVTPHPPSYCCYTR